jgi:hypothetical protein
MRATYETQAAENKHRTLLVDKAEQNLTEARASVAGANAASLIGIIDQPDTGSKPIGPGRSVIALGGLFGGLMLGGGVLFLAVPMRKDEENGLACYPSPRIAATANGSRRNGKPMNLNEALQKVLRNGSK